MFPKIDFKRNSKREKCISHEYSIVKGITKDTIKLKFKIFSNEYD